MFLSKQQQYVLDIIHALGHIRVSQLQTLVCRQFHWPENEIGWSRIDPMLHQLQVHENCLARTGDLIGMTGRPVDPLRLEAVDVMLQLSGGRPKGLQTKLPAPALLRFTLEDDLIRLFTVAKLPGTGPPDFSQLQRAKMEQIIWLMPGTEAPLEMVLPHRHFLAVRQPDGTHRFYKSPEE